jgi:hypothetical protein
VVRRSDLYQGAIGRQLSLVIDWTSHGAGWPPGAAL